MPLKVERFNVQSAAMVNTPLDEPSPTNTLSPRDASPQPRQAESELIWPMISPERGIAVVEGKGARQRRVVAQVVGKGLLLFDDHAPVQQRIDRKSTRLNSSHL